MAEMKDKVIEEVKKIKAEVIATEEKFSKKEEDSKVKQKKKK